jgi:hypothetical protein
MIVPRKESSDDRPKEFSAEAMMQIALEHLENADRRHRNAPNDEREYEESLLALDWWDRVMDFYVQRVNAGE